MATYHLTVKIKSRGKGHNVIASAAYRANEKLHDERTGKNFRFRPKEEVAHSEILAPKNAPAEFQNREKLWNAVEKNEYRSNARLAREFEFSLPREITNQEKQLEMAREFLQKEFVEKGFVVDFSLHRKNGNPHIHAMVTDRQIDKNGNWSTKKDRSMNKKNKVSEWRKSWESIENKYLQEAGFGKVSCESYEKRGIKKVPTIHEGVGKNKNSRKKINEEIKKLNLEYQENEKIIAAAIEKKSETVVSEQPKKDSFNIKINRPDDVLRKSKWNNSDLNRVSDYYYNEMLQGKKTPQQIGRQMVQDGFSKKDLNRVRIIETQIRQKVQKQKLSNQSKGGSVPPNPVMAALGVVGGMVKDAIVSAVKETLKETLKTPEERLAEERMKKKQKRKERDD